MDFGRNFPDIEEIDAITEVSEVSTLLDDFKVEWGGLETLYELKERLKLEYDRRKGISYKKEISRAISESGDDNAKKRGQLTDIMRRVIEVTEVDQATRTKERLDDFLEADGTSRDLHGDCESRITDLQDGECILIVAGETSAGKSSVLNLIFEEEILPVFAGSCTSTITTVRYGHRLAKIVYQDTDKPVEEIPLDEEGKKKFNDLVFMRGNEREDGHQIKEIQLYLPLAFLKSGLVLADTPGIGETEFLEKYLIDYISKNQILGFVYVIMSDAAGGVREDRLLLLLKMIIEEQKKRKHNLPFDPKAALFICNRFDAIPEEGRLHVQKHIKEHLQKFWPEFEPGMAVFFSAQNAQRDVQAHPDYVNEQYRTLLEAKRKLVDIAMDRRIKASYKWVEKLLQRITHFLKTMVKRLDMSEKERQTKSNRIRRKLHNLTTNTNTVIYTLKTEIREVTEKITDDLKMYLQKPQVKFKLCSAWKEEEIPKLTETVSNADHWQWIKSRVDQAFYIRLCNLLDEWGDEACDISELESRVVDDIRAKLGVLEEEICEIEYDMRIDTASRASNSDDDSPTKPASFRRRSSSRLSFSFNAGASLVDTPTKLPLQVLPMVKHESQTNVVTKILTRRDTGKFTKNPETWARERAEKLLAKLIKDKPSKKKKEEDIGILRQLVTQLLQRPRTFLEMVERKVPSIIDADERILQTIEDACLTDKKDFAKYEEMMINIEGLRKRLKEYGEGYIFVDDFKSNEIKIIQPIRTGESLAKTFTMNVRDMIASGAEEDMKMKVPASSPRGLWTVVNPGMLKQGDKDIHIAIRFYLPSSGVQNTFAEVAKLKCLTADGLPLAEFLGIHHAEIQLPAFIYNGDLQNVQRFLLTSSNPQDAIPEILMQTADAVDYISGRCLVHMELTTSTVTVNEHGQVRITGACMPRRATLPLDEETVVGDFVYLAPEVLHGDLYITPSDVYSFGLFAYELLTRRLAFQKQRGYSIQSFKKSLNPDAMLFEGSDIETLLSQKTVQVIKQCLTVKDSDRIPIHKVRQSMKEVDGEFRRSSVSWKTGSTPGSIFRQSSRTKEKNAH